MSNQHSKCDDCYKTHLPENHDRTILPSAGFSEGYVPEFNQASEDEQNKRDIIAALTNDYYEQLKNDTPYINMTFDEAGCACRDFARQDIEDLIRTEKLKLLDEVIHQSTVNLKSAKAVAGWAEIRKKQLEAEL